MLSRLKCNSGCATAWYVYVYTLQSGCYNGCIPVNRTKLKPLKKHNQLHTQYLASSYRVYQIFWWKTKSYAHPHHAEYRQGNYHIYLKIFSTLIPVRIFTAICDNYLSVLSVACFVKVRDHQRWLPVTGSRWVTGLNTDYTCTHRAWLLPCKFIPIWVKQ